MRKLLHITEQDQRADVLAINGTQYTPFNQISKVKLYIAPVKPAPEGDGVFSGAQVLRYTSYKKIVPK